MTSRTTTSRTRRRPGRRAGAALLVGGLVALGTAGAATPAAAAPIRPFVPVFTANVNGDLLLTANTLMTCVDSPACTTARSATSGNHSNNDRTGRFVDVDGDASTFNSSSATLSVPSGGGVLFAALVWGGRTNTVGAGADPALRGTVRLSAPGGGVSTLTASRVDVAPDSAYQGYVDVTDLVRAAGSGSYTVANVQSTTGATNNYAGWSLVVAVSDPTKPMRNLTVFNGYASVANGDPLPPFDLDGFLTPPSGPVRTTVGAVTYEGDMGITGDTATLDSTRIGDALNPTDNPFNSTISTRGAQVAGRNPSYTNQLGFDADLFAMDGVLPNGATRARITLTSTGDQYFPGLVTFATDLYDPQLLGTKTVLDVDGGDVEAGDTLRYTVPVENIGLDTADDSRFFDAVPTGTTYVPGSARLDGVPQTDPDDDADTTSFVGDGNGHLVVHLGDGATRARGGRVPLSDGAPEHVVTFDVTVDAGTTDDQELVNLASLTYRGLTTGAAGGSVTNAVVSSVVSPTPVSGSRPTAAPFLLSLTPAPGARDVDVDVLSRATDPDAGDPLRVVAVTDAAGGTVTVGPAGVLTYAPRDDFAGRDAFTYTIEDAAGNRSTSTVQVDVVNRLPVAADDAVSAPGGAATPVAVLAGDTDANGDALSVRSAGPASARGGTVTLAGGVVTYRPPARLHGTDTFTYVVSDSRGGTDTATVTVTVPNSAPVPADDTAVTTAGSPVAVSVLGNDADADADPLTAAVVSGPANGTLTLAADGTGTYTPRAGWSGTDTVRYRVADGHGGTAEAVLSVSVDGAPIAGDDAVPTAGDRPVDVDVLLDDSDPDGDPLTVTALTQPAHGTAVLLADGRVRYTPHTGSEGADWFTYTVSDGRGMTATATVTVTVANQPPVATPDSGAAAYAAPTRGIDVLANDADGNPADVLSVVAVSPPVDAGGTVRGAVSRSGDVLTYTPPPSFSGEVTFSYDVSDGTDTDRATVTVTVGEPGMPVAADDTAVTDSGTPVDVDVVTGDADPEGSGLSVTSVTRPAHGSVTVLGSGALRYMPADGHEGADAVDYTVTDARGRTSVARLTVTTRNAVPVAGADPVTTAFETEAAGIDVLANDGDANPGDTLALLAVTAPLDPDGLPRGTVTRSGRLLTYTPPAGFSGTVTFGYEVGDGDDSATGVVTVTVSAPLPRTSDDTFTVTGSGGPVRLDVLGNDVDPYGGPLRLVSVSAAAHGRAEIVDGAIRYTPEPGFVGAVTLTYTVEDSRGGTSTGTLTLSVGSGGPAPDPTPDPTPDPAPTSDPTPAPGPGPTPVTGGPAAPATAPTAAAEDRAPSGLASTGARAGGLVVAGLALLGAGAVALLAARHRRGGRAAG